LEHCHLRTNGGNKTHKGKRGKSGVGWLVG
jgi:hypothetical protein